MSELESQPHQSMPRVLILSDNEQIAQAIHEIISSPELEDKAVFDFVCSPGSPLEGMIIHNQALRPLNLKSDFQLVLDKDYSLVISGHCKQLFPRELVEKVRCVNIHPGLNPYNRGMFPHVFSLINGLPTGATLHEIDAQIDHGAIIAQEEVRTEPTDTSGSLYDKIIEAEKRLLARNLGKIVFGDYSTSSPPEEGNMNTRKDYDNLKEIRLDNIDTFQNHINLLRALTHGEAKNAYYTDPETGKRIWVRVVLEDEQAENGH